MITMSIASMDGVSANLAKELRFYRELFGMM